MGFSSGIKKEVLLSCARHCCVCHRYAGVKVEVHHIVPKDKGGKDSFCNAIALCFDCHCDAGHYNDRHPRGTKFSRDELIAARDRWYEIVRRTGIAPPQGEDILYCRYLLCKSIEAFGEITRGELDRLPFRNAFLVDNAALQCQKKILQAYSGQVQRALPSPRSYKNVDAYLKAFPSAAKSGGFYETIRLPSLSELSAIARPDSLLSKLLHANVPISELAIAVGMTVEAGCGGPPEEIERMSEEKDSSWFEESCCVRSIWGAFLAITNESNRRVHFKSIVGTLEEVPSFTYRQFTATGGGKVEVNLPPAPVPSGGTILVPLGVLMPPLQPIPSLPGSMVSSPIEGIDGEYQEQIHTGYEEAARRQFHVVGPLLRPQNVSIQDNGVGWKQVLHDLDLMNLYVLDRNFYCGSCPHVFLVDGNNRCSYAGELFSVSSGKVSVVEMDIPIGTKMLLIAELQKEITHIQSIYCGTDYITGDIMLKENEFLKVMNVGGKHLTFTGSYELEGVVTKPFPDPMYLNEIIYQFMWKVSVNRPSGDQKSTEAHCITLN